MTGAPYPADTKAKGWRFELDLDRVRQSDTWALASADARPWLLMLWVTAWDQTPCGSLPSDHTLIAARIGMRSKAFAKLKPVLLRGWWPADDGRLYHPTITELVLGMLNRKDAERQRKAEYRARLSRGTDKGPTRDATGSDATGTGTGTGTGNTETEDHPHLAGGRAQGGEVDLAQIVGSATPTQAGAICAALRRAGIGDTNPGHPRLLTLIAAGATEAEFTGFASAALGKSAGFAWVLGAVENERKRAYSASKALHQGVMPARPAEPAWMAQNREFADVLTGRAKRTASVAAPFTEFVEVLDGNTRRLG